MQEKMNALLMELNEVWQKATVGIPLARLVFTGLAKEKEEGYLIDAGQEAPNPPAIYKAFATFEEEETVLSAGEFYTYPGWAFSKFGFDGFYDGGGGRYVVYTFDEEFSDVEGAADCNVAFIAETIKLSEFIKRAADIREAEANRIFDENVLHGSISHVEHIVNGQKRITLSNGFSFLAIVQD